jgi:hypothetical protein
VLGGQLSVSAIFWWLVAAGWVCSAYELVACCGRLGLVGLYGGGLWHIAAAGKPGCLGCRSRGPHRAATVCTFLSRIASGSQLSWSLTQHSMLSMGICCKTG